MENNQVTNVTLRCEEEKKYFPCPVCGELKELGISSKGKPYLTCNDCGVQLFIRGKEGIKKVLKQLPDYTAIGSLKKEFIVLNYYNELQNKIIEIENKKPLFRKDEYLEIQKKLILQQIKEIKKIFEIISFL